MEELEMEKSEAVNHSDFSVSHFLSLWNPQNLAGIDLVRMLQHRLVGLKNDRVLHGVAINFLCNFR